jgi:purine-nucleoside phosphorylase
LILGTGLADFAAECTGTVIPYQAIKGFPIPAVPGHKGYLKLDTEKQVVIMAGRNHFYEGWEMDELAIPVFLLASLGVKTLVVTNAAGGINPAYKPGDFVLIRDHINLLGDNPLRGPSGGEPLIKETENLRFVDMREAYSSRLRKLVQQGRKPPLASGVYAALPGPSFETPAEVRMLERLGADMVGMSTVPEVLAARYLGLEVLGISLITNRALSTAPEEQQGAAPAASRPLTHADNLQLGAQRAGDFTKLLKEILSLLGYPV